MEHFTIENDHIKSYTIMVTDWNDGPYDRVLRPHVIPFDHNLPVSALVEQLRQELLVKEPNLCMTGDLHLRSIQEPSLDNEALLKDVIPQPEDQVLHTNCYGIEQSRDDVSNFPISNHSNTTFILTYCLSREQILRVFPGTERRQRPPPEPAKTYPHLQKSETRPEPSRMCPTRSYCLP